mmetsp:Transcript_9121/g.17870  ORF Transcript_9121/g.17870 Transcript_9121/m.17870 type:complete len:834 (-) Transcript_9121:241-2742(-)
MVSRGAVPLCFFLSLLISLCADVTVGETPKANDKPVPVGLEWSSLRYSLGRRGKSRNGEETAINLLENVSGEAKPGRLMALMGPSGAGKSTLLLALSGQLPFQRGACLSGSLMINGTEIANKQGEEALSCPPEFDQCLISQSDIFFSQLSVEETLRLAVRLRASDESETERMDKRVDRLVERLALAKAKGTAVGDEKTRGLSGGEKRRLSIACELVGKPSVIFADEPTSGLDSFQATQVADALSGLAKDGHTVVAVIHQPPAPVWDKIDDLCLLSEGKVIYCGPAGGEVIEYFAQLGYACPPFVSASEYLLSLASVDYSSPEAAKDSRARLDFLSERWEREMARRKRAGKMGTAEKNEEEEGKPENSNTEGNEGQLSSSALSSESPLKCLVKRCSALREGLVEALQPSALRAVFKSFASQIGLLFPRAWRQISRDRLALIARLSSTLSSALIEGLIFFGLKLTEAGIQDRLGLLQVAAVSVAMTSVIKTVTAFVKERAVVLKEKTQLARPWSGQKWRTRGTGADKNGENGDSSGSEVTNKKRRRAYPVLAYFLSKLSAELPFNFLFPAIFGAVLYPLAGLNAAAGRFARFLLVLSAESLVTTSLGLLIGSLSPSLDFALALTPAVMLIFIVFGGLYLNVNSVPKALRFIEEWSPIKTSFQALCLNELQGMKFEKEIRGRPPGAAGGAPRIFGRKNSGEKPVVTGEETLVKLGFLSPDENGSLGGGADSVASSILRLCGKQVKLALVLAGLTLFSLRLQSPSFQPLERHPRRPQGQQRGAVVLGEWEQETETEEGEGDSAHTEAAGPETEAEILAGDRGEIAEGGGSNPSVSVA